jgi:hypothetical protein
MISSKNSKRWLKSFSSLVKFIWLVSVGRRVVLAQGLPQLETTALERIFEGGTWTWQTPSSVYGYPWVVPITSNPCSETYPWQGIRCSSNCVNTSCYVVSLSISGYILNGKCVFFLLMFYVR